MDSRRPPKWRFFTIINRDREMKPAARRIAFEVLDFFNHKKADHAWTYGTVLSEKLGLDAATISRAIKTSAFQKYFEVVSNKGRARTLFYPRWELLTEKSLFVGDEPNENMILSSSINDLLVKDQSEIMTEKSNKTYDSLDIEKETYIPPPPQSGELDEAVAIWNDMAQRNELPIVQNFTDKRKRQLKARLKECSGLQGWRDVVAKIERIPGLLGENNRGWRADFDFVLKQDKFTKLMEGSYDEWKPTTTSGGERRSGSIITAVNRYLHTAETG